MFWERFTPGIFSEETKHQYGWPSAFGIFVTIVLCIYVKIAAKKAAILYFLSFHAPLFAFCGVNHGIQQFQLLFVGALQTVQCSNDGFGVDGGDSTGEFGLAFLRCGIMDNNVNRCRLSNKQSPRFPAAIHAAE